MSGEGRFWRSLLDPFRSIRPPTKMQPSSLLFGVLSLALLTASAGASTVRTSGETPISVASEGFFDSLSNIVSSMIYSPTRQNDSAEAVSTIAKSAEETHSKTKRNSRKMAKSSNFSSGSSERLGYMHILNNNRDTNVFTFPRAQATGDVCELPQVIGTGPYRIPRWNMNPNTKRCELFYYSGCCGNGNNFPTYEACQVLCEGDAAGNNTNLTKYPTNKSTKRKSVKLYELKRHDLLGSSNTSNVTLHAKISRELRHLQSIQGPAIIGSKINYGQENRRYHNIGWNPSSPAPRTIAAPTKEPYVPAPVLPPQQIPYSPKPVPVRSGPIGPEPLPAAAALPYPDLQAIPTQRPFEPLTQASIYEQIPAGPRTENVLPFGSSSKAETSEQGYQQIPIPELPSLVPIQQPPPMPQVNGYLIPQAAVVGPFPLPPLPGLVHVGQVPPRIFQPFPTAPGTQSIPAPVTAERNPYTPPPTSGVGVVPVPIGVLVNHRPFPHSPAQQPSVRQTTVSPNYPQVGVRFPSGPPENLGPAYPQVPVQSPAEPSVQRPDYSQVPVQFPAGPPQEPRPSYPQVPVEFPPGPPTRPATAPDRTYPQAPQIPPTPTEPEDPYDSSEPVIDIDTQLSPTVCLLPNIKGKGPYNIPRWWYNRLSGRCELFYYSGCCGNLNNFPTCQLCTSLCEVDPCTQERDPGVGSLQIPRYFFNQNTKLCVQFTYFGSGGNRNNFATLDECRARCPESPNPCASGDAMRTGNGGAMQCGFSLVVTNTCPANFYCHVGSSVTTTVCCPKGQGDRCSQALGTGIGSERLPRWYFDSLSQQCREFEYKGLQGNENNFLSKADCENACFINPCAQGTPYRSGGTVLQCSAVNQGVCPARYFCHVGADARSTVCCPVQGETRCAGPMQNGVGRTSMQRWYFDASSRSCTQFSYYGLGGSPNNFLTMEDCESECPVFRNPCMLGNPCYETGTQKIFQCSSVNTDCPQAYYCHIGASAISTVCCPEMGDPCDQQVVKGTGQENLPRWFFDKKDKQCGTFTYSGMGGNQNNFLSLEQCQKTCRTYTNVCIGGEPLLTSSQVPRSCTENSHCPNTYWCHIGSSSRTTMCCPDAKPNPCLQPLRIGSGDENIPRWYYQKESHKCTEFFYAGSSGNQNNFMSRADCLSVCPEYENPCPVGSPPKIPGPGGFQFPLTCNADTGEGCPAAHWCHIGSGLDTTFCCPGTENRCLLPMSSGVGAEQLIRWYFNATTRTCEVFTYNGLKGNPNNFITEQACEAFCPVFHNPCRGRIPKVDGEGFVEMCSGENISSCGTGFFCHVGPDAGSTVCCPSEGDPCRMSVEFGTGDKSLPRFFYNPSLRSCEVFPYRGLQGNGNNFLSEEACNNLCNVYLDPCPESPSLTTTIQPITCAASRTCQPGYWCHFGANVDTTVCCRDTGSDRCGTNLAQGSGNANLPRWYYDQQRRQCLSFTYRGIYGNSNSFLTKEACEEACPTWVNPCPQGEPILGSAGSPELCNPQNPCPSNHWCHLGASSATTVCCQQVGDPCRVSFTAGSGDSALPRWYYDATSRTCRSFTYRGIRGNSNNFLTRDDCEATCPVWENPCPSGQPILGADGRPELCTPKSNTCPSNYWCHVGYDATTTSCCSGAGDACRQPLVEGIGQYSIPRWYFDSVSRQCLQFTYRGTKGSPNNFLTRSDCEGQCPVFVDPCQSPLSTVAQVNYCSVQNPTCPNSFWCHYGADTDSTLCCPNAGLPCSQPMARGRGSVSLPRFYYDTATRTCQSFEYTGMGGNQNNFLSAADCENQCPVFENPCVGGDPFLVGGRPQTCSPQFSCPNSYWCHVGAESSETVCCPNARDPCSQAYSQGQGENNLSRWYFDSNTRQCVTFTYRGIKGNQNNFLSKSDCESTCPVFVNPCAGGDPATDSGGRALQCSRGRDICPRNFWCHVGATPDSTVCCPGTDNPCSEILTQGTGVSNLPRWYYDSIGKQCLQFTYRGLLGNQNNFGTKAECESTCPVFVNPCSEGEPLLGPGGRPERCSARNPTVCGSGYWCHAGANQDTTVCCPGSQDPCQAQFSQGRGQSSLPRWYYNASARQCVAFTYRGLFGNQNNFLSKSACESRCPVWVNPCAEGEPPEGIGGQPRFCSELNPNCPSNYYCHVGADRDTSVCCPGRGNACQLPVVRGVGTSSLTRWYYNPNSRSCVSFTYSGLRGNQNNFQTLSECEQTCPVFENPCPSGDPRLDQTGRPLSCSFGSNSCDPGYWCHLGASAETTVCCRGSFAPCINRIDFGAGEKRLARWYFNPTTRACENFAYKGSRGNSNNFLTRGDCEATCPALQQACNGLRPSEGQGNGVLPRYYYDLSSRSCRSFTYRGAKGNPNNFYSQSDCEGTCPVWTNPCPLPVDSPNYCSAGGFGDVCGAGQWCHIGADTDTTVCCPGAGDACTQPLDQGVGSAVLPRFYYDINTRTCVGFNYRGTKGNQNNFVSLNQCESRCPVFLNPCSQGSPYLDPQNRPQTCNALTTTSSCPTGYWCHVGADIDTTVCCPGAQDPCNLSRSTGSGNANLPRWYYDSSARSCQQFTYTGVGGNQNNFVSQQACRLVCREFQNPCIGQPATSPSGQPVFCSVTNRDNCPVNFWCHIGATAETTLCCPGATNPCSVPLAPGTGSSTLSRYYYNADTRKCVSFQYYGMRGNQNNFLTDSECSRTCPVWINPCSGGPPATSPGSNRALQCGGIYGGSSCPSGYWCHTGSKTDNSVCCPGATDDVCALPRIEGTGQENLNRWYFDNLNRKCEQYTYNGRNGNQNSFQSREDCLRECPEFDNPCLYGEMLMTGGRPWKCRPGVFSTQCPQESYYCLTGQDFGVCCPYQNRAPTKFENPCVGEPERDEVTNSVKTCASFQPNSCSFGFFCLKGEDFDGENSYCCPAYSEDPCMAPRRDGEGNFSLQRFFYNAISRSCELFFYRGRKGNENNFLTKAECEDKCVPDSNPCYLGDEPYQQGGRNVLCTPDYDTCPNSHYCHAGEDEFSTVCCPKRGSPCDQQLLPGTGTARLPRFYYDSKEDECLPFTYTGQAGNQNNFLSKAVCEDACPGFRSYCPHGKPLLVGGVPEECGVEQACPNSYVCHINTIISRSICCFDPAYFCILPRDPGPCTNFETRYGYNRNTGTCTPFQYGSCRGNMNNFASLEECTEICCDKGY